MQDVGAVSPSGRGRVGGDVDVAPGGSDGLSAEAQVVVVAAEAGQPQDIIPRSSWFTKSPRDVVELAGWALGLVVRRWMEEESEAFTIHLAWEDSDGDPVDLGHWQVALHAIRRHLKRGGLVVSLTMSTVLRLVAHPLRCGRNGLRIEHTAHTL